MVGRLVGLPVPTETGHATRYHRGAWRHASHESVPQVCSTLRRLPLAARQRTGHPSRTGRAWAAAGQSVGLCGYHGAPGRPRLRSSGRCKAGAETPPPPSAHPARRSASRSRTGWHGSGRELRARLQRRAGGLPSELATDIRSYRYARGAYPPVTVAFSCLTSVSRSATQLP